MLCPYIIINGAAFFKTRAIDTLDDIKNGNILTTMACFDTAPQYSFPSCASFFLDEVMRLNDAQFTFLSVVIENNYSKVNVIF